jgi:hypothetical protein
MEDLSTLCQICYNNKPKYKCPRCGQQTCSLGCNRKHKKWARCSGERDQTAYVPISKLRTPAGIDHDYNFLRGLELKFERTHKMLVEERGVVREEELRKVPLTVQEVRWKTGKDGRRRKVVVTRELRDTTGGERRFGRALLKRLRDMEVQVLRAPLGMQRQRENKTNLERRTGQVNWQVEWLRLEDGGETTVRTLGKALEDTPLFKAYHAALDEEDRRRPKDEKQPGYIPPRDVPQMSAQHPYKSTWYKPAELLQEPTTGRWVSGALVRGTGLWQSERDGQQRAAYDYFLESPRQRSDEPRVVTRLEVDDCLGHILQGTSVIEFPTIYVLRAGETLPAGYVMGKKNDTKNSGPSQGSSKRKDGPGSKKAGPSRAMKRRKRNNLEEGEVGSGDDAETDDRNSVGTSAAAEDEDGLGGLEVGDVVAEESFDEDEDEDDDDDSSTSSSGTDSDEDDG